MSHYKSNVAMNNHDARPAEGEAAKSDAAGEREESDAAAGQLLRSLAKAHAEQLFREVVSASAEPKATQHLDEATFREVAERFAELLSSQVNINNQLHTPWRLTLYN